MVASLDTQTPPAKSQWEIHDLTTLVKGNSLAEREGNEARWSGTSLDMVFANASITNDRFVRVVVFRERSENYFDTANNNANLFWDESYNSVNWTGVQGDIILPVNTQKFLVYSDKTFRLNTHTNASTHHRYYVKHPAKVKYAVGGTGYNIDSGRIFIFVGICDAKISVASTDQLHTKIFTRSYFRDVV